MRTAAGLLTALMAFCPVPSLALDCEVRSVQAEYWTYKQHSGTFLLVYGGFENLRQMGSREIGSADPEMATQAQMWTGTFKGFRASRRAFDQPFETEVSLVFPDYSFIAGGSDSAQLVDWLPGKTGLVWLEKTATGYEAADGLCSSLLDTDPAHVVPLLKCLRGGYCPKD